MDKPKDSFPIQPGYWDSKIGAGTGFQNEGFDASKYGHGDSAKGGTYSWEISLALIFWEEMRRYQNAMNPPTFDGGIITEILGKYKCKIKLQGIGSVVTADAGQTGSLKKGMYGLVLCQSATNLGSKSATYRLIGAKNIKMGDSDLVSEYEA